MDWRYFCTSIKAIVIITVRYVLDILAWQMIFGVHLNLWSAFVMAKVG
jgi:hypothetical protein